MPTSNFTYKGKPYDFRVLEKNYRRAMKQMPHALAQTAVNFFRGRFKEQGWRRTGMLIPWRKRKVNTGRQRNILVKTGALRRKTRVEQASFDRTSIVNDMPYAQAHNDGFNGRVSIPTHLRTSNRTIKVQSSSLKSRTTRTTKQRVQGARHTVKAHTRQLSLPKRQFIGHSDVLNRDLDQAVERFINKIAEP